MYFFIFFFDNLLLPLSSLIISIQPLIWIITIKRILLFLLSLKIFISKKDRIDLHSRYHLWIYKFPHTIVFFLHLCISLSDSLRWRIYFCFLNWERSWKPKFVGFVIIHDLVDWNIYDAFKFADVCDAVGKVFHVYDSDADQDLRQLGHLEKWKYNIASLA